MALTERIDYIMQADATGLVRTLGKTSQALAQTGTDSATSTGKIQSTHAMVAQRLTGMGDRLVGVGKTMTAAVTLPAIGAFLALGNSAASAAREHERLALNLKGSAKATDEQVDASEAFLRKLALTTGTMKGETRPALSQLASATKDTTKAQELLTLAVDLSAAKGKPLEQVSMALSRAYNGNVTALGRMGIATKDASGKTKDFATIQAELQGSVGGTAETLGKTSAGAYDIARAKMAMLKADIAGKMLPAFTAFTDKIVGVVDWLSRMPQGLQTTAIALVAMAAAAGPITTIFGGILKGGGAIVGVFARMGGGAVEAGEGVSNLAARWQTFLNAAPYMAVAAAAVAAFALIKGAQDAVTNSWRKLQDDAHTFTQRLNVQRQAASDLANTVRTMPPIEDYWTGASEKADEANKAMFEANNRMLKGVLEVKHATGLTRDEVIKLAQANKIDLSAGTAESRDKLIQLAIGTGRAKAGLAQMSDQTARTAKDVDDLKEAMDDLLGPFLSAEQANASYQRSLVDVDKKLEETVTQFGRGQLGVSQLRGNVADLVTDWQRNYDAMARNGASSAQLGAAKEELRGKLGALAKRFPELAGTVATYTDRLNSIPTHIDTQATVDTSQAMAALGSLVVKMAEVAADPNSAIWRTKITGTGNVSVAKAFKGLFGRASGGSVAPYSPTLVGERGPEIVQFASAATVYPSDARPGIGGGGDSVTVVLNVAGSVLTEDDLARRIEESLARTKRRTGGLAFL